MINHHYLKSPTIISTLQLGVPKSIRENWAKEAYKFSTQSYKTNLQAQMSSYKIWEQTDIYNQLITNIGNILNTQIKPVAKLYPDTYYEIKEAWTAIYKKGEYAISHTHEFSDLSFVYYIRIDGATTPLKFDDLDFKVTPYDDMLVIFDATLWHSVEPHIGEDRVIIAGNANFKRVKK